MPPERLARLTGRQNQRRWKNCYRICTVEGRSDADAYVSNLIARSGKKEEEMQMLRLIVNEAERSGRSHFVLCRDENDRTYVLDLGQGRHRLF